MSNYSTETTFSSNGHAPAESLSFEFEFEFVRYMKSALSSPTLNPPPKFAKPQYQEAADSIYGAHKTSGLDGARLAWPAISNFLENDFQAVVEAINAPRKIVHVSELGTLPPVTYLYNREIPNGLSIVYGSSGAYKSFRTLDYAARIAQHGNVIYIAAEGAAGYDQRSRAYEKHFKIKHGGLFFHLDAVSMLDRQSVDSLILAALEIQPKLIVIDTLARCMLGGDENSAKDMGLFIDACNRLQRELNTAVLVVHHTGKGNGSERGSSALRGAADAMIEISSEDGVIRVSCSKSKDSEPFETYYLKPVKVELSSTESSLVLLPSDRVIDDNDTLTEHQLLVIEWLATNVFDEGARSADLRKATAIPDTAFYRALKTLSRKGLIEKDGRYDPWILTAAGKKYAAQHGYSNQLS